MAVYMIGFSATVYHNEFIEASSEEEANTIAKRLLEKDDGAFGERLYAGFTESAVYDVDTCPAYDSYGDKPTISATQLEELLA